MLKNMWDKVKIVAVAVLFGYCGWILKPTPPIEAVEKLPPDVVERIVFKDNIIYRNSRQKGPSKVFVPPEGKSRIDLKENGKIEVVVQTKGVCFRPGLGIIWQDDRVLASSSLKIAYWSRFGLAGGIPLDKKEWKYPHFGITYRVSAKWNPEVLLAVNAKKDLVFGLRLSF